MCFSLALLVLVSISAVAESTSVGKDGRAVIIDGQRRLIISGAIHYPRSTPGMWPDLMRKAKEGGLNAVETYVFWNGHEPRPGEYYFEGNYDLIRFLREVQNAGLYAILRIGPYVCAEWVYGGIPGWLRQTPGMKFRINNQAFESAMQKFTTLIVNKVKEANLLAGQGGPIILAQIENEYGNIEGSYNWNDAHQYVHWCARMAQDQNINIPWIMCQQDNNPPDSVINTCNGWYCDWWYPARKTIPKMWTENWMSFFKFWGGSEPRRRIEDIAFAVARFYQKEGTLQNYYMYHGGTNFGRTAGGPYITTTYDYYAPLDEYGNIRQPQYGHLKELHSLLMDMEKFIVHGDRTSVQFTGGVWITKWALNGGAACFISNANDGGDVNVTFEGATYLVPAWTVSILPDCTTVAYNTGKVKAQTSVMVTRPNAAEAEPGALRWSWMPENLERFMTDAYGSWKANKLLEQATFTYDYTDYMWYMTSVDRDYEEKFNLYVKTFGHGLHAFVNGELVGSKYAPYGGSYEFEFKAPVTLRTGKNYISLLSATVGLRNYGDRFEETPVGIAGGPVKLLGASNNFGIDISGNTWAYKAGLDGEERQVHLDGPHLPWQIGTIPVRRPFTWYKTTFQSPPGIEPVAVDLLGLGKGMAWVNGNSLGRYWVTAIAPNHWPECYVCPKKGSYKVDTSCRFKCGEPSQRWYHVPRSFLNDGEPNTLVLFEENGGDPSHVNFQTVSVGPVCANVDRGEAFTLSCEWGRTISSVDYASFGNVRGECGRYSNGCDSPSAFSIISKACVGKESCTVQYNDAFLQGCNCFEQGPPVLTVQATC